MKAAYIRLVCAALISLAVATLARAAPPEPVHADVVVTVGGQSFGFAGPLRYFAASESGGRIGLDVHTLATPGYAPRPDVDAAALHALGNRWQVTLFGRAPQSIDGTCAAESFATTEAGTRVQHLYLNCADLEF